MPNKNINPQVAVQNLAEVLQLSGGSVLCAAGDTTNQIAYIVSLPEAVGVLEGEWQGEQFLIRLVPPNNPADIPND